MEFCWIFFSGCFEGPTAWNLAYFVDFVFNETVFVSSLDKMTCESIGSCVDRVLYMLYLKTRGEGGYSIYPWVGRCGLAPHTLTVFKTNIADFPTVFKTELRFLMPCLRHRLKVAVTNCVAFLLCNLWKFNVPGIDVKVKRRQL